MDPIITELETKMNFHQSQAKTCAETIRNLQALCDHPAWDDDGQDSHYRYKRCRKCGKREQR
jgi:dissimilatory sulfite reductase (desulfoviridin) alpha/beta subunit